MKTSARSSASGVGQHGEGYSSVMTAPGQEPDEIMTATPGGKDGAADSPDLDAVGDNHMPEDLRRAERESSARSGGPADGGPADGDPADGDPADEKDDNDADAEDPEQRQA